MPLSLCKTIVDYPGYSTQGAMPLLYAIRDCIPFAFSGLLVGILLMLFAGSYFLVKARTGRAKVYVAFVSSTFVMVPLSLLLALAQLVSFTTVLFYSFLAIVAFALLIISDYY